MHPYRITEDMQTYSPSNYNGTTREKEQKEAGKTRNKTRQNTGQQKTQSI